MLKIVLGLIVGVIVAFAVAYGLELVAHSIYPGVDPTSPSSNLPLGMQAFVIAAYFLAALIGGLVGGRIANRRWVAWAVAAIVAASAVATIFMVEQPLLMSLIGVIAPLVGGYVAARMVPDHAVNRGDGGTADAAM